MGTKGTFAVNVEVPATDFVKILSQTVEDSGVDAYMLHADISLDNMLDKLLNSCEDLEDVLAIIQRIMAAVENVELLEMTYDWLAERLAQEGILEDDG